MFRAEKPVVGAFATMSLTPHGTRTKNIARRRSVIDWLGYPDSFIYGFYRSSKLQKLILSYLNISYIHNHEIML